MNLNTFRDEVSDLLRTVDPECSVSTPKIIEMLNNEFEILKDSLENPGKFSHQIYDMMFLLFEMAAVNDFDLDAEWQRGREKKQRYIKVG